jgi:hypothetical protein
MHDLRRLAQLQKVDDTPSNTALLITVASRHPKSMEVLGGGEV